MFVFPAIERSGWFFFCHHHARFGASSHINDVARTAALSIGYIIVFSCFSQLQAFIVTFD